jgi:hypothetical protein
MITVDKGEIKLRGQAISDVRAEIPDYPYFISRFRSIKMTDKDLKHRVGMSDFRRPWINTIKIPATLKVTGNGGGGDTLETADFKGYFCASCIFRESGEFYGVGLRYGAYHMNPMEQIPNLRASVK